TSGAELHSCEKASGGDSSLSCCRRAGCEQSVRTLAAGALIGCEQRAWRRARRSRARMLAFRLQGTLPALPRLSVRRRGDRLRAQEVLRQLEEYQRTKYVSPHDIGLIYTALGERDLAFEWLEKAFAERTFRICELFNPTFDSLCSDARFQDLACRIGI